MRQVILFFRYLGSGNIFTDLLYIFRMGISTISMIVREVCCVLWICLHEECIPIPSKEKWKYIATAFWQISNFPNVLGVVDGKQVEIINPLCSMYGTMVIKGTPALSLWR